MERYKKLFLEAKNNEVKQETLAQIFGKLTIVLKEKACYIPKDWVLPVLEELWEEAYSEGYSDGHDEGSNLEF